MKKVKTEFIRARFRKLEDLKNPKYGRPVRLRKETYTITKDGKEQEVVKFFLKCGYKELNKNSFITEWKKGPTPQPKRNTENRHFNSKDVKLTVKYLNDIRDKKEPKVKFSDIRQKLENREILLEEVQKGKKKVTIDKRKNLENRFRRMLGSNNVKEGILSIWTHTHKYSKKNRTAKEKTLHLVKNFYKVNSKDLLKKDKDGNYINAEFKQIAKEQIVNIKFKSKRGSKEKQRQISDQKRLDYLADKRKRKQEERQLKYQELSDKAVAFQKEKENAK